jgi:1-acyl-sn-glycerol-3-phosphate acyltransferase
VELEAPMKKILRPIQFIYCFYALFIFACLTIVSLFAMLFILPLGEKHLTKGMYKIARYFSKFLYLFLGMRHQEIYEGKHDFNQAHVFVGNHNSYMDIPPIVQLKHQPIKPLGKFESSKIPLFGLFYRHAVILVDRSNAAKRAESLQNLKAALKSKISIFIFPEGTFSMTDEKPLKDFYNGAFKLAIEMQVPIQPVLMVDSVDRMHFSSIFTLRPGICRVVYLPTVYVDNYTLEDLEILKQQVHQMMHDGLRRYRYYPAS